MDFASINVELLHSTASNIRALCPRCSEVHNNRKKTLSCHTGRGLFQCFRCGWKGRVNGDIAWTEYKPDRVALETQCKRRQYAIDRVYHESMPISAEPSAVARHYLRHRLGSLPEPLPTLRCHLRLRYYQERKCQGDYPALISEVRDISGRLVTLHRTYLTEDGHKAPVVSPKKLMGVPEGSCTGAAIRLQPAGETLILCEGIETALALSLLLHMPAWACISAHGLESVVIPNSVCKVHIGADHDKSGAGQLAARRLANRLWRAGWRDIEIHTPESAGDDWADVVKRGGGL